MLDKFFNQTPTIYKYDKFFIGFVPALLLPLLVFPFFYFLKEYNSFKEYMSFALLPPVLSPLLSLGCIFNLGFFFLFISKNYYNSARGVIAATIFYILPVLYLKFSSIFGL